MVKNKHLDFELLRTFIAVVDNGSLTRAANQIHRSQSAISMQIKRLESQLEQKLFERSGRSVALTFEGKSLVAYARRLLNLHDQAITELTKKDATKHIRVGCPDDYTVKLLPVLLKAFREKIPDIRLSVYTANSGVLRQAMDNKEIDIAILTRLPNSSEGVLVYQEQGTWVAKNKNDFMKRPLPLVLFEPSCKFHSSVIDGLEKNEIEYDLICDASHLALLAELVRLGQGVSVMPKNSTPDDLFTCDNIDLPELPVIEVVISLNGGNQCIAGWAIQELATKLANFFDDKR